MSKWVSTRLTRWIIEHAWSRMDFGIEAAYQVSVTYEAFNDFAKGLSFLQNICLPVTQRGYKEKAMDIKKADMGFIFPCKLMLK